MTENSTDINAGTMPRSPVAILGQYIKDLSFENPNAPASLRTGKDRPVVDVNFALDIRKVEAKEEKDAPERMYEVTLGTQIKSLRDGKLSYMMEIQYAVIAALDKDFPEDQVHPFMLIEMPRFSFPFLRQIVANTISQAGFLPLYLDPIDFRAFYLEKFASKNNSQIAEGKKGTGL